MNRRTLLQRFAVIAAVAVAAGATATAEAAPSEAPYVLTPPMLTFESMAADCAARGCWLERHDQPFAFQTIIRHSGGFSPAYQISDYEMAIDRGGMLARVDTWRRGLHEPEMMKIIGGEGESFDHYGMLTRSSLDGTMAIGPRLDLTSGRAYGTHGIARRIGRAEPLT